MNINNNFTPLAWHQGNIELQSNRASYAFGHIVPLIASRQTLIPFQIITESGAVNLTSDNTCDIRLRRVDGTDAVGSNLRARFGLVKVVATELGCDVLVYNGGALNPMLPTGQYYLTLTSGNNTWYSDVLTIVADVTRMTRLTWWDAFDLKFGAGMIAYRVGGHQYKNVMYFLEELGMPEYTTEEEGETRDGLFYAVKILSGKKYKMTVGQCTEAMCDALRFVHLSDYVEVRDGYGRTYSCDTVLITPEWVNGGAVAKADIELTTDTFVKQLGGGYTGDDPVVEGETGEIGEAVIGETFTIGA